MLRINWKVNTSRWNADMPLSKYHPFISSIGRTALLFHSSYVSCFARARFVIEARGDTPQPSLVLAVTLRQRWPKVPMHSSTPMNNWEWFVIATNRMRKCDAVEMICSLLLPLLLMLLHIHGHFCTASPHWHSVIWLLLRPAHVKNEYFSSNWADDLTRMNFECTLIKASET